MNTENMAYAVVNLTFGECKIIIFKDNSDELMDFIHRMQIENRGFVIANGVEDESI